MAAADILYEVMTLMIKKGPLNLSINEDESKASEDL